MQVFFQILLAGAVHDVDVIMVHVGFDNPEAQCAQSAAPQGTVKSFWGIGFQRIVGANIDQTSIKNQCRNRP